MKKFLFIAMIGMVFWSCGGGDDPAPTPPENKPPTDAPIQVYPTNNLLCIENEVTFQWGPVSDPDGGSITYKMDVAKNSAFSPIAHTKTVATNTTTISLEKGVAYYWRVKAIDNNNASGPNSSTNQFYTEGEGVSNHVPFTPALVAPALGSIVQEDTVTLEWTASDVDNDDLSFDVYFGATNPPTTKVSENQTATTHEETISASTDYYWKIVVKDGNGGQAIGQIWSFKTD